MATNDAGGEEVKWQVAFFALVPLALGTMTQPVGRVLDTPPEWRFWLRSAPLFCAADMLFFLVCVAIDYALEPAWSWRHFRAELAYRFRDEDWSKDAAVDVEKAALGRWILTLLGGLPCQTIKLMAMRGIPKTQTAALMLFLALVFGEILNVAVEWTLRNPTRRSSNSGTETSPRPPSGTASRNKLTLAEALRMACHYSHVLVCAFMTRIFGVSRIGTELGLHDGVEFLLFYCVLMLFIIFIILLDGLGILSSFFDEVRPSPDSPSLSCNNSYFMFLIAAAYFAFLSFIVGLELMWLSYQLPDHTAVVAMILTHVVIPTVVGVVSAITYVAAVALYFPWLAGTRFGRALGIPQTSDEREHVVFFFVNLSFTVVGFAFLFDGEGTVNPTWVGIFG